MNDLIIKEEYRDNTYTTMSIEGLSVEEMSQVLEDNKSLGDVMANHDLGRTYIQWHNGYGIYGIRHVGGHLFVTIGNSCD